MIISELPTIAETLASTPRSIFQCIVQEITLFNHQGEAGLEIEITSDTPCLTDHQTKTSWLKYMKNNNPVRKNTPAPEPNADKTTQPENRSKRTYNNTPFRYASGGALPLVKKEGQLYFMMFHRDIFPEGWNIANGSSSDLEDLKNPQRIVQREFHEELMILNTEKNQLIAFEGSTTPNSREIETARTQWQTKTGATLTPDKKQLSWIAGPHHLSIKYNDEDKIKSDGYFLSITPEDFSIELDKIVCFELHKGESLIDGELFNNRLINRLIGLFKVETLTTHLKKGTSQFVPDIFFYSGTEYLKKDFSRIFRQSQQDHEWKHKIPVKPLKEQLSLCPITKSIINQAMAHNIKF